MGAGQNVDPTLRALGGRGRYQLLQVLVINLGAWGAAFQLMDNIFIGRTVDWHQCAAPRTPTDSRRAEGLLKEALSRAGGTSSSSSSSSNVSSRLSYGKCRISVMVTTTRGRDDGRQKTVVTSAVADYPCQFGYQYGYGKELSFRTEFDLVCDHALLADLLQTLVILGQGCGAVLASVLSDRYGRKRVLVYSQLGLLAVGLAIGLAPTYTSLAFFKFLVGCLQQGVVTGKATMSLELFPSEERSLMAVALGGMWVTGNALLALTAFLLQGHGWRCLQCALSAVSVLGLLQMGYLDESLRWLVANGRREEAERVLRRAARVNRKDPGTVLGTLYNNFPHGADAGSCYGGGGGDGVGGGGDDSPAYQIASPDDSDQDRSIPESGIDDIRKRNRALEEDWHVVHGGPAGEHGIPFRDDGYQSLTGTQKSVQNKLTIFDLFKHRRLRLYTLVIWVTWFTCAFCTFTLFLMSSGLHGNRFLNFFLIALTEVPACLVFYGIVDSAGRKSAVQLFFVLSAVGIVSSGFCRALDDSWLFGVLSVLTAMLGSMGSVGVFGAMFFYTPEVYPTNVRQQALGFASFAGRFGGMLSPFMVPLSEHVVWLPGAITGTLCVVVIFLFRFLPETQGRELPQTLADIDAWGGEVKPSEPCPAADCGCCKCCLLRKWTRVVKRLAGCLRLRVLGSEPGSGFDAKGSAGL